MSTSPKQKSVKPKLVSKKILVLVNLLNSEGGNATAEQNVSKVVAWYKKQMASKGYFADYVTNFKISHVADDLFEFEYKTQDESFAYPQIIADPDDDGNHPIKIGKLTYLISGHHIKTTGSISKPKKAGAKKVIIRVSLSNHTGAPDASVSANAKKIIAWYKKQIKGNDYYKTFISYFTISHIVGDVFAFEHKSSEADVYPESIANPDDDGNHELKIGKANYLVYGHVLRKF